MKGTYHGMLPVNARITVDYKKHKVNFGYPSRHNWKRLVVFDLWLTFLIPWCILNIIGLVGMGLIQNMDKLTIPDIQIPEIILTEIIKSLSLAFYLGLTPLLFAYATVRNHEFFMKFYPKFNYWCGKIMGMRMFKKEFKNIKSKTVEIPLFTNVILHYIAKKDYSKYLEKVQIIEHPFKVVKKIKDKKAKPNTYIWKALFTFSKIPKVGNLTVYFH